METLGILFFFLIMGMAFWVAVFLGTFVPYMATLLLLDKVNPKLAEKLAVWK